VTAIIRDNVVYVAWVGDARCVVFRRGGSTLDFVPITTPHLPQGVNILS
jgi:serine/threonine protein phosphatase PrpC